MKIVLDTNVLIDGFKDEYSYEKKIINAVIGGEITAYANKQTLRENRLLLGMRVGDNSYLEELNRFFSQVNNVVNRRQIHIVSDPEDNKILESAVEARVDYLVTNDKALLELNNYQNIKVVTPIDFWKTYKDEGMDLWKQWINYVKNSK
ncbi:MAG: putative toxin-antitoxin system toxin component, PIN family [Candidatus Doudnabacteria bacterium]|nr:putative toxin-antitoxin system toxin component, PIN family [Candidatus Doudnabacteria bacterium]